LRLSGNTFTYVAEMPVYSWQLINELITHADEIGGSIKRSTRLSLCASVCPHDRTKTAKTTITKLAIPQG